jgi:predicted dehydrogenase
VLCEKPLGVNLEESRALVRDIRVPNAVNFPFASSPVVESLQKRLPQPRRVEIRFHFSEWPRTWQRGAAGWLAKRAEGGFLREVFSHFAYLTIRLLGPVKIRSAKVDFPSDGITAESYVMANLEAAGVPIHLTGGVGGSAPDYNEWTAYGEKESIRLTDWSKLWMAQADRWQEIQPDEALLPNSGNQLNSLSRMLRGEPHPLPSFARGLEVQELVEALLGYV